MAIEVYSKQRYSDKVCKWVVAGWWFSPGTPVSSTNKTDRLDIAEPLLKETLNIINQTRSILDKAKEDKSGFRLQELIVCFILCRGLDIVIISYN